MTEKLDSNICITVSTKIGLLALLTFLVMSIGGVVTVARSYERSEQEVASVRVEIERLSAMDGRLRNMEIAIAKLTTIQETSMKMLDKMDRRVSKLEDRNHD